LLSNEYVDYLLSNYYITRWCQVYESLVELRIEFTFSIAELV